jgi:hypothetical protein
MKPPKYLEKTADLLALGSTIISASFAHASRRVKSVIPPTPGQGTPMSLLKQLLPRWRWRP